mmetsp:Transcript_7642/g.8774  ORF Transcript_7642/g.8774 Transcript_7642/m.8774 type:complete len:348 (+) Transcript_7642:70-1113(+)|eukprot:CAMPEP_0184014096 /NCGR_PEP_ID=MMETSP0954-20121128/5434_1 /TAXON_ID=627963 /ORGANISM="Aplanochytrium sp, Strain PBS07" /LENGTH=347 /DNA_ID=CAMNT_0026294469 /DNA_START=167 /DNA_END=1210 /DNA_ORIENTATION=-
MSLILSSRFAGLRRTGLQIGKKSLPSCHLLPLPDREKRNVSSRRFAAAGAELGLLVNVPGQRNFSSSPLPDTPPLDLSDLTYWPIDSIIRLVDTIHTNTGYPWWVSIAIIGVSARILGTPIQIKTKVNSARMMYAQPEMKACQARMDKLKERGASQEEMMNEANNLKKVWAKHKCNPLTMFGLVLFQIPLYSVTFFGIRRMCENFSELSEGGAYWFTDLTVPDPTYGLAVVTSAMMVGSILAGGEDNPGATESEANQRKTFKNIGMAMGLGIIPISMYLPAGVMIYFVSTSSIALLTSLSFKIPGMDKVLGYDHDSLPGVIADKAKITQKYVPPHARSRSRRRRKNE